MEDVPVGRKTPLVGMTATAGAGPTDLPLICARRSSDVFPHPVSYESDLSRLSALNR